MKKALHLLYRREDAFAPSQKFSALVQLPDLLQLKAIGQSEEYCRYRKLFSDTVKPRTQQWRYSLLISLAVKAG
jgi:hypothetical protein